MPAPRRVVCFGMPTPRVFTIPPSAPFVPTLIRAFTEGTLVPGFFDTDDPLARARATLYLPTRRACRLARDIFLDATGERAAILPRIVAIGDIDEDEIAFGQEAAGSLATTALELPAAIEGLERRLLLMQLVMKWADGIAPLGSGEAALVAGNPASALALADELARLIDDMTTREISWDRLRPPGPGEPRSLLAAHSRVPEDCAHCVAGTADRAWRHRTRRPARRADQA